MPFLLFLTGGLRLYEENMCVSNQKISVQGKKICLQPIQPRHKRSWTEARKKEGNFPVDWTSSGDTFFVMQVAYNAPGLPILSNPNCGDYFILDTSLGLAKITIWLLLSWFVQEKDRTFPIITWSVCRRKDIVES